MKTTLITSLLLCLQYVGNACTIIPNPFCTTVDQFPENLVLTGVIVGIDDTGIDFEVLEILRGEESRDTIRIWDGTDFDCNGIWSMAAADIGSLFDTIIIILPKIIEIENVWDVPGDYRRPDPYYHISALIVKEGNAEGFIAGYAFAPPEYNLWSLAYDSLTTNIIAEGECPTFILATDDVNATSSFTVNNPVESVIRLQLDNSINNGYLTLYSIDGYTIIKQEINGALEITLECGDLPAGMYLIEVYTKERREIKKIIKQDSR